MMALWRRGWRQSVLVAAVAIAIFPMLWMGYTSLKTREAIARNPWSLPMSPTLDNYRTVWRDGGFARHALNSLAVTGGASLVLVAVGSLAGYAFGRCRFRGQRLLWLALMAGLFLPVHVTLIPLLQMEVWLRLAGSGWCLAFLGAVYVAFNLSFTVFFLRGFYADLPTELEDAARVDGCGTFGVFWRVMLPLSLPALTVVTLVNVVMIWNEFVFALVLVHATDFYTLPVAVQNYADEAARDLALTTSAMTLTVLPVIVLFLVAQRWLLRGLTVGAVKG